MGWQKVFNFFFRDLAPFEYQNNEGTALPSLSGQKRKCRNFLKGGPRTLDLGPAAPVMLKTAPRLSYKKVFAGKKKCAIQFGWQPKKA